MSKIKVNEKLVGGLLILLGLSGLLMGFQQQPAPQRFDLNEQSGARSHQAAVRSQTPAESSQNGREACQVLTVYDGDTVGCDSNKDGKIQRPEEEIRLLGIDTPERSYSRKNRSYGSANPTDEPYAKESSAWMERRLGGKTAYLEYDVRHHDRYGRTLAFVYTGPTEQTSLNLEAVREGYARKLFLGKNRRYEDAFTQAEQQAREQKRGLWGVAPGDDAGL